MHMVRTRALVIGLMVVGLCSSGHATPFIIELTNGNALRTPYVWEEGGEVKFFIYDGAAGVPKALVRRITKAPHVSHDSAAPDAAPPPPDDQPPPEDQGQAAPREADADRAEQARLTSQLEAATARYQEASAAHDPEAKQTALADMRASRKRILELGEAVKAKHAGMLPAWWNE